MAETAPSGFLARNNQVIGSVLSIIALIVAALMGAGLMFGTDTRGVRAILTVLTIAGGAFALLLLLINAVLRGATSEEQWQAEEEGWRTEMGLAPTTEEERAKAGKNHALTALLAVLAILVGIALSLGPSIF